MKITTVGKLFNEDYTLMSLADIAVEDYKPATFTDDSGNQTIKKTADGKEVYKIRGVKVLRLVDGKASGEVRNASIQIVEKPAFAIGLGARYQLDGKVEVNHWFMNGNSGITITADKVIPVNANHSETK